MVKSTANAMLEELQLCRRRLLTDDGRLCHRRLLLVPRVSHQARRLQVIVALHAGAAQVVL